MKDKDIIQYHEYPEPEKMELDMYAEGLIYAYEHPQHKGQIAAPDATMHEENISCGDKITVYVKVASGRADDVRFDGVGCVISMGSADILAGSLKGKKVSEILKMGRDDMLKLINIDPGPVRLHCATLALRAVKKAIFSYEKLQVDTTTKEL